MTAAQISDAQAYDTLDLDELAERKRRLRTGEAFPEQTQTVGTFGHSSIVIREPGLGGSRSEYR